MLCPIAFLFYHTLIIKGRVKRKRAFEHAQNAHLDHPAHAQSNIQDLSPVCSIQRFCKQPMKALMRFLISDLDLHCPHMPKDNFLHGAAHII